MALAKTGTDIFVLNARVGKSGIIFLLFVSALLDTNGMELNVYCHALPDKFQLEEYASVQ